MNFLPKAFLWMIPATRLLQKAADRAVVVRRRDELDTTAADEQGHRVDALVGDGRAVLQRRVEQAPVRLERLVEVGHRDAEMVDAADGHAADATSGERGARGSRMRSTSPYSTASAGVMKRSRSMSSITCSNERPVWCASTSAI